MKHLDRSVGLALFGVGLTAVAIAGARVVQELSDIALQVVFWGGLVLALFGVVVLVQRLTD